MNKNEKLEAATRLLREAENQGLSKAALGRLLGVERQTINAWRTRGIPLDQMENAAGRLKISIEYLKTGLDVARFHHQLTEEQRRILDALSVFDEEDRKKLMSPIFEEAERIRRYLSKK